MDCCKNKILDPKIKQNTDCCDKPKHEIQKTRHYTNMSKTYYTRLEDKRNKVNCSANCEVKPTYVTSRIDKIKYGKYARF